MIRTFKTCSAAAILALCLGAPGPVSAQAPAEPYPVMAPFTGYASARREDEIALARSAAPPSISDRADVLVLGARGYEVAVKGDNGFVCVVERGWANDFTHAEFWNPKVRSPICFNPASARTVLPTYLERTEWVLAGVSRADMAARTEANLAQGRIRPPEAGSMCFMLSKAGYLGDDSGGHWRPHLMFFTPRVEPAAWGANLKGSPVMGDSGGIEPLTVFMVPVAAWSDGTPASGAM